MNDNPSTPPPVVEINRLRATARAIAAADDGLQGCIPAHRLHRAEADLRRFTSRDRSRLHWFLLYLRQLHRDRVDCQCNGCGKGAA